MRRRWWFVAAALLIAVGGWLWWQRPIAVEVSPVRKGRIVEIVYATGIVKPAQELLVDAKVSATVKAILVKEGQSVRRGQVLAVLDASDFEIRVREAERRWRVAEAALRQLEAGTDPFDLAALQAELDAAIAQWQLAQKDVESARTQLETARARYQQAEEALKLTEAEVRTAIRQAEENVRIAEAQVQQAQTALVVTKQIVAQEIAQAEAALRAAEAQAALVEEGAREEERERAKAALAAAKAALEDAQRTLERAHKLFAQGAISKAELDAAQTRHELALAQLRQAEANWQQVQKGARPQEREAARAQVAQATALVEKAKARQAEISLREQDLAAAQARLEQAQAQLQSARANERQIALRRADVDAARAQVRQAETLLQKALDGERVARARVDALRAKIAQAQRGARPEALEVARREYALAKQVYEDALRKLDDFVVRAPVDGVVTEVVAKVGSYLAAGFGMSTVVKMATGEEVFIEAQVDEADIGKLRLGGTAFFKADAFPERTYRAVVARIYPEADPITKTYKVELRNLSTTQGLKLGMSGDVNIVGRVVNEALLVPTTAVVTEQDRSVVWVVQDGRVVKQPVEIGARDAERVHLRNGVSVGTLVVINPPANLKEGRRVIVKQRR